MRWRACSPLNCGASDELPRTGSPLRERERERQRENTKRDRTFATKRTKVRIEEKIP